MDNLGKNVLSKLPRPRHIPEQYTAFQFVKVCKSEKYLDDFVSGKLYMSTMENISNIEHKDLTKGQLDTLEGTEEYWQKNEDNYIAIDFLEKKYLVNYFKKKPIDRNNLIEIYNVQLGRHKYIFRNIYCMYTMWFDIQFKSILTTSPEIISTFGDYAAIVTKPYEFVNNYIKAVVNYPKKFNTQPSLGFVEYVELRNKGITQLGVYRKDNIYINQNEFRLCLDIEGNKKDLCYFEIGDLSDVVAKVKTKDLVYNSKIEGDCLMIGDRAINFNFTKY